MGNVHVGIAPGAAVARLSLDLTLRRLIEQFPFDPNAATM
jgi:hypothetical protein